MISIELKDVYTGLTEGAPDPYNDITDFYDASADELKKIRLSALAQVALSGSQTVNAGFGFYVPSQYEIPVGATLEIAAGAVMEIG